MDNTKTSISVMFAGAADGTPVPPMVVNKAENLRELWCQNGPKGARYAVLKSGWFDMVLFEMWFEKSFLPIAKKIPGKKVLLATIWLRISASTSSPCERKIRLSLIACPERDPPSPAPGRGGIWPNEIKMAGYTLKV